jgi:hypothetical protein
LQPLAGVPVTDKDQSRWEETGFGDSEEESQGDQPWMRLQKEDVPSDHGTGKVLYDAGKSHDQTP